jgi:hypothetical protein
VGDGTRLAAQYSFFAGRRGRPVVVVIGGATLTVLMQMPPRRDLESIIEAKGINEGNPDIRRVQIPANTFASASNYPNEEDHLTITEGGTDKDFTILARNVRNVAGVDTIVWLMIYRTPPDAAATNAAAGETNAGGRKQYVTGINPL